VDAHQCAKFRQNRSIGCKNIKIFWFFKMAAVRHFGFVWGIFGPPTVSIWGSLSLQNLVMIDTVFFTIWTFQYLARLAGKCLLTPQNRGFWAIWSPKWTAISTKAKKGTSLRECASFVPLSVYIWRVVWPVGVFLKKGGINKKNIFSYISPMDGFSPNFAQL